MCGAQVKKIKTEEGEAVTQEDAVDEKTKEETSKLAEEFLEQLKKTMQEKSAVNQVRKVNGQWRLKVDSLNGARRKPLWIACQLWGCRGGRVLAVF